MKITYRFINGDIVEIEADQEIGEVILELERQERCNDHTETRRHSRLDCNDDKSSWQIDERALEEGAECLIRCGGRTFCHGDRRLKDAASTLTNRQKELLAEHIIGGVSVEEYAKKRGLTERAVWSLKKRTLKNLKSNL